MYTERQRERKEKHYHVWHAHTKTMPTVRLKRHIQKFDVLKIAMQTQSKKDKQNKKKLQN